MCIRDRHSTALDYELETDIQLFEKKHIDDAEQIKPSVSFWDTLKSRMNVNNMIYALKVSLLCVGGMPVSYTHLDVYKRQTIESGKSISFAFS